MRRITQIVDEGQHPLGRHVEHDERSKMFRVPRAAVPIASATYARHCSPFDQAKLGTGTGTALAGVLMTDPFRISNPAFDESDALRFYKLQTTLNTFRDVFPR